MLPHLGPHQTVHAVHSQDHVASLNLAIVKLDFDTVGEMLHFLDSSPGLDKGLVWQAVV